MDFLVNIDVDDLQKAVRFYSTAFDLRVGRRFGAFGAEMLGGPTPIYLLVKKAGTPASEATSQVRAYERHWTPTHLDFVVGDIESAVEKAVLAGARLEGPIATRKWGKLALMADPFGHGFCLVQFLDRGYDEIADRLEAACSGGASGRAPLVGRSSRRAARAASRADQKRVSAPIGASSRSQARAWGLRTISIAAP